MQRVRIATAGTPVAPRLPRGRGHLKWHMPRLSLLHIMSLIVTLLAFLPLAYLLMRALGAGQEGIDYLLRERTLRVFTNSLQLVLAVSVSATVIGVVFAWLTTRTDLPYRRYWLIAGLVTMVVPSYLGAITYVAAFGPKGIVQGWLAPLGVERLPEIYGFTGAWISITLFTYPYVVLPVRAALLNLDRAQEEAARSLGLNRWQVFRRVALPQLRPALAAGMLLTALYTLSDFGAVAVMRYNVFTRAIYLQYTNSLNRERAALLALVLILCTLFLLALERRMTAHSHNYHTGTGAKRIIQPVRLGRWHIPASMFCGTLVGIGVGIPIMMMVHWLTNHTMVDTVEINMPELALNTVGVAVLAAVVVGLTAMPLGILSARASGRMSRYLVGIAYLGNALPGIVIGLTLVFFGIRYLPGLYQTIPLLIMGYTLRFLPVSVGATRSVLTQVNPHYEEAARSLGLKSWQVTWRVTVPMVRTGIAGGMALVFLSVMKELPTTLILAPIGFRTLATRIWSVQEEGMYVLIGLPGLVLIAISALSLALILRRNDRAAG